MTASICHECCGLGAEVEEKKGKRGRRGTKKEESSRRSMLHFSSPSPSCQPALAMSAADLGQEECRTETKLKRVEKAKREGEKKRNLVGDQKGQEEQAK
jgi:hypothetical protein